MTGAALLGRSGLRPTRPSSARLKTLGGSDLLRRIDGKWVRFKSALTFIDGASLSVKRSRQRYERLGPHLLRYVDLGLYEGFEAQITVDENGLIESYEGLFERVAAGRRTV